MSTMKKIDHLAIVVKDVDTAVATFSRHFGFPVAPGSAGAEPVARRVRLRIGDATLDLCAPAPGSPAAAFLAERGEGMYQLVLEVDDLATAAEHLRAHGVPVTSTTAGPGAKVALLEPQYTHGVPMALVEHAKTGNS